MKRFLERIYFAINSAIAESIRPLALKTKEWIKKHRERREDKREELITKILNFSIQGERVVTVPNFLSILRPFLMLIAVVMQLYGIPWYLFGLVIVLALITDKYDGAWAEIDGHTTFGEYLDPLCDKLSLFIIAFPFLAQLSNWVVYIMFTIEIILLSVATVGFVLQGKNKKERTDFRSNIFGKTKFMFQSIGICLLALSSTNLANIAFAISIPLAIASIIVKVYTLSKP